MTELIDKANEPLETHPWQPFVPEGAKALIMGTFPPGAHRRAMDFFYPNPTNDFWKVMGMLYYGHADALYDRNARTYRLDEIKKLLCDNAIALGDTGHKVRRLKGNASDKFLEIVEPVDLAAILERMPDCRAIATTGEKAAGVLAALTGTEAPKMGQYAVWRRRGKADITLWRLPSTSRAYPMPPQKKAEYYAAFLRHARCLN